MSKSKRKWTHRGDYVTNTKGKMVAATSAAAAFVHKDEWAQDPATFNSNDFARQISALPDLIGALQFISDGLHRAANGGFTAAGEKWTVGKLKSLIRNYRDVAEAAIVKTEAA